MLMFLQNYYNKTLNHICIYLNQGCEFNTFACCFFFFFTTPYKRIDWAKIYFVLVQIRNLIFAYLTS